MILNPLQKFGLTEFVRRHLGEEGHLDSHSPELGLHYVLANDRPEHFWHKGERFWTTGPVTIAAAVGNVSEVEVFNPPGSGVIVVVTYAASQAGAASAYLLTIDGGAGAVPVANTPIDTRVAGIVSQNRISNASVGVSGTLIDRRTGTAGADLLFEHQDATRPLAILSPNHRLNLWCGTVNTALTAIFKGYEFTALPMELT